MRLGVAAVAAGIVWGIVAPCTAQIVQGPVFNPVTGSRYFVYQAPNWNAAQAFARSIGGDLATVNDAAEDAWIVANLTAGTRKLFIGLNDAASEGTFVWSDGSTATYRHWLPGEPGVWDYAEIQPFGGWQAVVYDYTPYSVIEVTGPVRVPGDYPTIQSAINGVQAGTEILVAGGTYNERLTFGAKPVRVRSIAGAEATIIDGQGGGTVVTFGSGAPESTSLEGFTVRNGNATVGGGIKIQGGAAPTIRGCILRSCHSTSGNVYIQGSTAQLENCRITQNFATSGAGFSLVSTTSPVRLINCLIDGNSGTASRVISVSGCQLIARNCTIAGNGGPNPIAALSGSTITIHNSIVWEGSPIVTDASSTATVTYTDIVGGFAGTGNIDADPRFIGGGDYRVTLDSPCIDAGDLLQYAGYGGMSDLAGEGRAVDVPTVANTGNGRPPIDMGAFEFQPLTTCPADFNHDNVVNSQDFFEFLTAFFSGC